MFCTTRHTGMIGWVYFVITTTSKDLQHWPRRLLCTHLLVCSLAWCLSLTDWVRNVNKSLAVALTFAAITYPKVGLRLQFHSTNSLKRVLLDDRMIPFESLVVHSRLPAYSMCFFLFNFLFILIMQINLAYSLICQLQLTQGRNLKNSHTLRGHSPSPFFCRKSASS